MPGQSWVRGTVTSADGARISHRRYGAGGPGVVLLPGGAQAAQNLHRLAEALADQFTVYEPPLSINHSTPVDWLPRYERELARGEVGAAAVTAMRGTRTAGWGLRLVPRPIITAALNAAGRTPPVRPARRPAMRRFLRIALWPLRRAASSRAAAEPDEVPLRDLIPTMRYDARVVMDSEGTLDDYASLTPPVLLLGGSRSAGYLTRTLGALQRVLPRVTRIEYRGAGHTAPDNTGEPQRVAADLRRFFTAADVQ